MGFDFSPVQNDWVICRVFQKSCGGKKVHISGMIRCNYPAGNGVENSSLLPPLADPSPCKANSNKAESGYVHCFSNFITPHNNMTQQQDMMRMINFSSIPKTYLPSLQIPMQDPAILRNWLANANYGQHSFKTEKQIVSLCVSQETGMSTEISSVLSNLEMGKRCFQDQEAEAPSTAAGPQDFDCLWSY